MTISTFSLSGTTSDDDNNIKKMNCLKKYRFYGPLINVDLKQNNKFKRKFDLNIHEKAIYFISQI